MITITPATAPQIQYPVVRRNVHGTVVLFFSPTKGSIIKVDPDVPHTITHDLMGTSYSSTLDISNAIWTPVDVTITG
jgi:hypothetical protein